MMAKREDKFGRDGCICCIRGWHCVSSEPISYEGVATEEEYGGRG